jgi:xylulose-5-phosphate/fructose-6-phosphate phosphoketolase
MDNQTAQLEKYLRLTDYLSAAQLYLRDNFLLEEELKKEHLKLRLLGHWGTVPGINFIYACLNVLIKKHSLETMLIVGPGHGYPGLLSNLFVEGTLGEYYPDYVFSKEAIGKLIHNFSWPGGFPSHANPETPGVILEGGELGYSLATAFGAAFDNPNLLVTCIVGDGEAETASLATAWHSNKFSNPKTNGAVLPIVHINKYKISGPTIYGTMSHEELTSLFIGYGYEPIIVESDSTEGLITTLLQAMEHSLEVIQGIQKLARVQNFVHKPKWPVILFINKKGWSGPKMLDGKMIENSFRSHGIPLEDPINSQEQFDLLKRWLESYRVSELLTAEYQPIPDILDLVPPHDLRIGKNKHANGEMKREFHLPKLEDHEVKVTAPGAGVESNMKVIGNYLKDCINLNPETIRIMSPDETESNKLHALFDATKRGYLWPVPKGAENTSIDGRVMEVLSENTLMGWMQGYILTGRQSVFISYEAFLMIIASMVDQFIKFLIQKEGIKWRQPLPSLNFILTSNSWRQDHNGFSHQNPGFISNLLNKGSMIVRLYFPVDANMLLVTMEECFQSTDRVNLIIAGKTDLPQYLTLAQAREQSNTGVARWSWAGNQDDDPDVVIAATGDYMNFESLAALKLLKDMIPELKTRFVSVSEINCFGIGENSNPVCITYDQFQEIFTKDKQIIFGYHGYPDDIKQLIYRHPDQERFHIHGYTEHGTTTTPFDMLVANKCSRYHIAQHAIDFGSKFNPFVAKQKKSIDSYFEVLLEKHKRYIHENGTDMPEITGFKL